MSLAFNLFFWDDWLGVSTTAGTDAGSTIGGKKDRFLDDWPRPDFDFWYQREQYLRNLYTEVDPVFPTEDPEEIAAAIAHFHEERAAIIFAIRNAPDIETMQELGPRLAQLNNEISSLIARETVARLQQ